MRVLTPRQIALVLRAHRPSPGACTPAAPGADPRRASTSSARPSRAMPAAPSASATPPPELGPSTSAPPKRLAVFVSGGGSNFRAIHAAIAGGACNAVVAAVVTNAPSCGGADFARAAGIPVLVHPPPKADPSIGLDADALMSALLHEHGVDFIVLAGYMKLVPPGLVRAYRRAILNIHPGLLPSFGGKGYYGQRVHAAVIASGARFSGPTVHFVDEEYDTGPILAQATVPVYPTDTAEALAARVLAEEHKLYPRCVAALCHGRVTWREDGIPVLWTAH